MSNFNVKEGQKSEVINAILAYSNKQKEELKAHVEDQKMVMAADAFFDETDGVMSKEEFVEFIKPLTEPELRGLEQFLNDIRDSRKLTIPFFTKTDKAGKRYYWVTQNSSTTTRGYKLVWSEKIDRLITAYQFQMYRFELSLGELFAQATNKEEQAA